MASNELIVFLTACLCYVNCVDLPQSLTTKWPEICRVMRLTKSCTDDTFRLACPNYCKIECSNGFEYLGSKGMCFAMTYRSQSTWAFAEHFCHAYEAKLATITDATDAEILSYLVGKTGTSEIRFGLGAVNFGTTKVWTWLDGVEFAGSFWAANQPVILDGGSNCLNSYKNDEYKHESNNCKQNTGFVCEQIPIVLDLYDNNGIKI